MSAEERKKGETQLTLPKEAKMFSVATGLEMWKEMEERPTPGKTLVKNEGRVGD